MPNAIRRILLVQLPVPPPGAQMMSGNIPLAAAFLKLHSWRKGFERDFEIEIFPTRLADTLGDRELLAAILERTPDLVGFTCYLWNIERSLWLAEHIKLDRPKVKILLGGPEITADNHWVLDHAAVDYAVFGEGEIVFAELLGALRLDGDTNAPIAGLWRKGSELPEMRKPVLALDEVSSPYIEGILDASENQTMLLETVRGCRFRCKYCYYSKCNADLRFLSYEQIEANLNHAIKSGVREVYLLDPTINQRPDFADFLRLLARCNPARQLTFSGELRAEGIDGEKAKLLKAVNFTELEIGLQSVDPHAQRLMGRPVNLNAWRQGVRCLMAEGIRMRLDLILGLPGDTADSIRRGIDFLSSFRPEAEIQIFNLSILPGTEFRREAAKLGLRHQAKPPYYVFRTPTLDAEHLYSLMEEAQTSLGLEFDEPSLPFDHSSSPLRAPTEGCSGEGTGVRAGVVRLNLDDPPANLASDHLSLITTLQLQSVDFSRIEKYAVKTVADAVRTNPHITLQIVLEPRFPHFSQQQQEALLRILPKISVTCYFTTSYLDYFYSLHPGHSRGAKQTFVLLPVEERKDLDQAWIQEVGEYAAILWHGEKKPAENLDEYEYWIKKVE